MIRLFVGLELPESVKRQAAMCAHGVPGARWQDTAQMHITLRFIGEVSPATAEDVDAALRLVKAPGFTLCLAGAGVFGDGRKTRSLWLGVEPETDVQHLRDRVESALVRCGLPPETRKFKPHMTLARFGREKPRRLDRFLGAHHDFRTPPFDIQDFALFESRLGTEGAAYQVLARYPLTD